MNTGIGDAVNLAWKLAAVLAGDADARLLATYERERIGFARRLVATTDRGFTLVTKRGRVARFLRTRLVPLLVPRLFRLSAVRKFLFATVSQIGVNYRTGWLSEGATGRLRGGERLPWVATGTGQDNFGPLTALAWQVHVYGQARRGLADACADLGLGLHQFAWRPEMDRAGFRRSALYLVRPDGYVALADARADPERLRRYFREHGLGRHRHNRSVARGELTVERPTPG
jgi:hypothetical protein